MDKKIEELTNKISDLKKRLPAHSVPPSMMQELEELEAELETEKTREKDQKKAPGL